METEGTTALRLNKFIAHAGICNRNQAVDLIKKGEITVNGNVELQPFYEVKEGDTILYKGKVVTKEVKKVYLLTNKAKNTPYFSSKDAKRPAVEDLIKKNTDAKLQPVGIYHDDDSGLVLMTNDTELLEKLSQHGNKVKSVFEVELDTELEEGDLAKLRPIVIDGTKGVRILGMDFPEPENKKLLGVELVGGFASDIIEIFNANGVKCAKCDCTFYGGLTKKDLKRGWSRLLSEKEVIFIKHFS